MIKIPGAIRTPQLVRRRGIVIPEPLANRLSLSIDNQATHTPKPFNQFLPCSLYVVVRFTTGF